MNWEIRNTDFYLDGEKISLYELFKKFIANARKQQNKEELQVFQTVVGESDRVSSNESITDARVIKAIQNIISGNNEVLEKDSSKETLLRENAILEKFIPVMWCLEETARHIHENLIETIKSQDKVGKAIAATVTEMSGLPAQKIDIANTVKEIWSKK